MFKRFLSNQNGQVAVIVSILIIAIVGMAAYVVDTGSIYETRRDLQTVADSAALAGAQELPENTSAAIQTAIDYAARNNVTISSDDITISRTYVDNDTISVRAEIPGLQMNFAQVLGRNSADVIAFAKAVIGSPTEYNGVVPWGLMEGNWVPGQQYTLKYGAPPPNSPGNFGALAIDGKGNSDYVDGIKFGTTTPISVGDWIDTKTGDMGSNTEIALDYRVTQEPDYIWNSFADLTVPWNGGYKLSRSDSQFVIIPVITSWPNGAHPTQIVEFVPFIITSYSGNPGHFEVNATFLSQALIITTGGIQGIQENGIRIIRLVR